MRPTSTLTILNNFLFFGFEKGIFEAVEVHKCEDLGNITTLGPLNSLGMVGNGAISVDEYLGALDGNQYSAVFDNGDLISIQCRYEEMTIHSHRYLYIPCPFSRETVESKPPHASLSDWLRDSAALEPRESFRSKGSFRFDCDRSPMGDGDPHPISHLTFATGECRMPLRGPLQISAFLNFVFDNFFRDYRPLWWSFSSYMKLRDDEITISLQESSQHHISWEPALW